MKHFTPLQITTLAMLSLIVVALAFVAFGTADHLAGTSMEIVAVERSPEIVYIGLADPTSSPEPIPTPTATPETIEQSATVTATSIKTNASDIFCTLTINGTNIPVRYGVEESTLEQSPGYLPSSALPGAEGTCAIYGHRNRNHFKVLQNAELGDNITVTMADGTNYTYVITDITIYESTSDWTLPFAEGKTLVLVTCYPFSYSGSAPGKCMVRAVMD